MSNTPQTEHATQGMIGRREAIRRAAALLGVVCTPGLFEQALRAQAGNPPAARRSHLSPEQTAIVVALAERILPRTDTPGAGDVGVPAFIDLMYGEFLPEEERRMFASGLASLDERSRAAHRAGFAGLGAEAQDALLTAVARESANQARTFFHQARELTILGYFTSEQVQKTVLHYDPIPGRWDACVPLSDVGDRAWAR